MSLVTTRPYPKVRAPQCDGAAVSVPEVSEGAALVAQNRALIGEWEGVRLAGEPLEDVIPRARAELVQAAIQYTQAYRSVDFVPSAAESRLLLLSGHQPELFHAGVWFKNFVLHRLAAENHGLGVHLLIDNDLLRQRSLLVPTGTPDQTTAQRLPFDDQVAAMPFEAAFVEDRHCLESFAQRVNHALRDLVPDPTLNTLWPDVLAAVDRGQNLGAAFSEARHRLEARWGLETLEVPLSHICNTASFRQFMVHVLSDLERFQQVYNHELREFKRAHRVRSHSHPAPPLRQSGEWFEAPFWGWLQQTPRREPLWVRPIGGQLEVRLGETGRTVTLPDAEVSERDTAWAQLEVDGLRLRPRAIMTTMYARLFLSDLFLHGIGGGKYDQLTDRLIETYWGLESPEFMIVSATVRVPHARPLVEPDDIRQLEGLIRQLWFHPEFNDPHPAQATEFEYWVTEKRRLLEHPPGAGEGKRWHDELEQINAQLRNLFKAKRSDLLSEKNRLLAQSLHDRHLSSREYSFSLLPETRLKKLLLDLVCTIA